MVAWLLTFPAAAGTGGLVYGFTRIFGTGATGPVIAAVLLLAGLATVFALRVRQTGLTAAESPA